MLRLTIYVLETSTTRSVKTSGTGYITAVWDCQGQGYRNLDAALATAKPGIISIMKVHVWREEDESKEGMGEGNVDWNPVSTGVKI